MYMLFNIYESNTFDVFCLALHLLHQRAWNEGLDLSRIAGCSLVVCSQIDMAKIGKRLQARDYKQVTTSKRLQARNYIILALRGKGNLL